MKYLVEKYPGIGSELDVIIPVVGECDDSWLNDIAGRHVRDRHVYQAIDWMRDQEEKPRHWDVRRVDG